MLGMMNAKDFGVCGSAFETECTVKKDSCTVTVQDIGDFSVGQEVCIRGAKPRLDGAWLFGPHEQHAHNRPVNGEAEFRGWVGENGGHVVYLLDFDPDDVGFFRWSDDMGTNWQEHIAITHDWQTLSGGLEVRIADFDWSCGWVIAAVLRASLVAQITAIDGQTLTLDKPAGRNAVCTVVHSDTKPLQCAIDAAVKGCTGLFLPNGHYRLSTTLVVNDPKSFTLRGESAEGTVLEIEAGSIGIEDAGGSCLNSRNGEEFRLYDLSFLGGMGFADRDKAGHMKTRGATGVWGFYFNKTNALCVNNTKRVYLENCHARRMSAECFYSSSVCRTAEQEPEYYTRSITYLRCSVEDCARNAFNNNDMAENTHLIDCRIRDVGGCTWEGASRFVQMRGCYVRNAGAVAMGNVRSRSILHERLGTGQHVIEGNTFESGCPYGLAMITASACATQVLIRGNTFVNFNSNAIRVTGDTGPRDLPARNVIITGNSMDMTPEEGASQPRTAIEASIQDATISDNQIFTNLGRDENLTGILLRDDSLNAIVHDNLLRDCGKNIITEPTLGEVGSVIDDRHFLREQDSSWRGFPPVPRRRSDRYHGWRIFWENGGSSVIEDCDPETGVFTLKASYPFAVGDRFHLKPAVLRQCVHDNLCV